MKLLPMKRIIVAAVFKFFAEAAKKIKPLIMRNVHISPHGPYNVIFHKRGKLCSS